MRTGILCVFQFFKKLFLYKNDSYKYTKFGNISQSETKRNVEMEIQEGNINVILDGKECHLDLIYKFETKVLEDHVRIATRISEKTDDISCLLYINHNQAQNCIQELKNVKKLQENNMR